MNIILNLKGVKKEFSILEYERNLQMIIKELSSENSNLEKDELLDKAALEHRNVRFFLSGLITQEELRKYLESKNFSSYPNIKSFLNENKFYEFPILYIIYSLGVPMNTMLKCLGLTRREIVDQMKLNGLVVNGILNMEIVLTTFKYHPYNHYSFYVENRSIAEKLAVEMLKNKVFRSKISDLMGFTYMEIDNLKE